MEMFHVYFYLQFQPLQCHLICWLNETLSAYFSQLVQTCNHWINCRRLCFCRDQAKAFYTLLFISLFLFLVLSKQCFILLFIKTKWMILLLWILFWCHFTSVSSLLRLYDLCFVIVTSQREDLKMLLSVKDREEGGRGSETVKVQLRSALVSHFTCTCFMVFFTFKILYQSV